MMFWQQFWHILVCCEVEEPRSQSIGQSRCHVTQYSDQQPKVTTEDPLQEHFISPTKKCSSKGRGRGNITRVLPNFMKSLSPEVPSSGIPSSWNHINYTALQYHSNITVIATSPCGNTHSFSNWNLLKVTVVSDVLPQLPLPKTYPKRQNWII